MRPGSRIQRAWIWHHDSAPGWFAAYTGWLWRPYCWARRHHTPHHCDVYFEVCTVCLMLLWAKRDGVPNPTWRDGKPLDRVTVPWRRQKVV